MRANVNSSTRSWRGGPFVAAVLVLVVLVPPVHAGEEGPGAAEDPVLGSRIVEGAAVAGRLWLRGLSAEDDSGGLVSWSLADGSRRVDFASGVHDFVATPDGFWVLRVPLGSAPATRHDLVVSRLRGNEFHDVSRSRFGKGEQPLALALRGREIFVLTTRRVWTFSTSGHLERDRRLSQELKRTVQVTTATLASDPGIYVALDHGEFGGGLWRVDPRSGEVAAIESNPPSDSCEGHLLDRDCSPVTGVIADPDHDGCLLASVGLSHLGLFGGRILRVCGDRITLAFEPPLPDEVKEQALDQLATSDPIFGLAAAPNGDYWAVGLFSLYRFAGGAPEVTRLPDPQPVGGLRLTCAIPGVVLLDSDVNWIVSVSGSTPLLVPLEPGATCGEWMESS
jgi:hypothetical protein